MTAATCRATLVTPPVPGAIAVIQLHGDVETLLHSLTGHSRWPAGAVRLCRIADIDHGLVVRLDAARAQCMPHGGPRIVRLILDRCAALGTEIIAWDTLTPGATYPEASDEIEARMLAALARAASPLAIDLLLDQPRRWRDAPGPLDPDDRVRATRLNRLINPPRVVVAGPANVGKSTLSNRLLGRGMSVTEDQPGTTRDYVCARMDLGGLVVDWFDTPGLRASDDRVEQHAIDLTARVLQAADLLIALTDAEHDWPALPREPDLRVASKSDLVARSDADLCISATMGDGLDELVRIVTERLVPRADRDAGGRWVFDSALDQSPTEL